MATARIDGILAREVNTAVIFRRGPSKLTQQLVWDLSTDKVTSGQWIEGHVYTRRCDVSPDGRYLIAAMTNYSRKKREREGDESYTKCGWTAISRPPYFTAIALWFTGGAWNGGGLWESNRLVRPNNFVVWEESKRVERPVTAKLLNLEMSEDEPLFSMLMKKRGWIEDQAAEWKLRGTWKRDGLRLLKELTEGNLTSITSGAWESCLPRHEMVQAGIWHKSFAGGSLHRYIADGFDVWSARNLTGSVVREWKRKNHEPQFLDMDKRGRVIFGDRGCLWAWVGFPNGEPTMIADLNANSFAPVAPPGWAQQW